MLFRSLTTPHGLHRSSRLRLFNNYCFGRAGLHAGAAADAKVIIDFVLLVWASLDGLGWAALGTSRAADTGVGYAVMYQGHALFGRAPPLQMSSIFIGEISHGRQHRIRRGATEPAQTCPLHLVGQMLQCGKIAFSALPGAETLQNLAHAPGSHAARRTLPA